MNKAEFTNLIKNPNQLGNEHIETLKKIVADYPYFSTAHVLLAKALLNTNHYEYEKQLKVTALSVGDRSILHQFLSDYELESENFELNVPIGLKVEKVSKPDFEPSSEEQKALVNEAKEIIANYNITETNNEKTEEPTPTAIAIEPEVETIALTETTEENSADNEQYVGNQIALEHEEITSSNHYFTEENNDNFTTQTTENLIENTIEIQHIEPETLIENTTETPINEKEEIVDETDENTQNDINYQLTETEGILVRFSINENFLPDFDEASLFTDELNIETITKSVLPIVNTPTETNLEPENNATFNKEVTETVEQSTEITNQSEEIPFENNELVEKQESNFTANKETETPAEIITLENLLDFKNNDAAEGLEALISNTENETEFETLTENTLETETNNLPIIEEKNHLQETANVNGTENTENTNLQYIDYQLVVNNNKTEITPVESHNFIEWLAAKNKNEVHLAEFEVKTSSSKTSFEIENDDFVEKINQILKTKADFELNRNIANEINSAHNGMVPFERKTATIEIPETDEEPIENEVENGVDTIIEIPNSTDDEVFDEIETFKTHTPISNVLEANIVNTEPTMEEENAIENHFIEEIYTGQVESILPDFDALQNADSIAEEENTQQEIISVSAAIEKTIEVAETNTVDDEQEEVQKFDIAPINETDFDAFFEKVYEPIVIEKQEVKTEIEAPKVVAKNNTNENSKLDVESILDKFMRENPSITRPKSEFFNPANVAKQSVEEKDEIVSETLAGIYLKQGLVKKAISTYEKLSLIYPHKITYFAALINKLKTEHNIN